MKSIKKCLIISKIIYYKLLITFIFKYQILFIYLHMKLSNNIKVIVERSKSYNRFNDIKVCHTSILQIFNNTFTLRGFSKYLFDMKTMTSIGREQLKVTLI